MHYQPIVALQTGAITGVEALVRWRHPQRGLVFPCDFVPAAEQSGLIVEVGRWVLERACVQAGRWQDAQLGLPPLWVSVNVSMRQLRDSKSVEDMTQVIRGSGLDPANVVLEITESELVCDVLPVLERFRALGVRVAIDDFGTGYSSLGYLWQLPIDIVKVDKSFLASGDRSLTLAVVRLLEAMNVETVVEGIERPDQFETLRAIHGIQGQGSLFSRPLEAEIFGRMHRGLGLMLRPIAWWA